MATCDNAEGEIEIAYQKGWERWRLVKYVIVMTSPIVRAY